MASERPGLSICLAAQASAFSRNSDERRMVVRESCRMAGRPLFFRTTFLRCAAISVPTSCFPIIYRPRGDLNPANGGGGDLWGSSYRGSRSAARHGHGPAIDPCVGVYSTAFGDRALPASMRIWTCCQSPPDALRLDKFDVFKRTR